VRLVSVLSYVWLGLRWISTGGGLSAAPATPTASIFVHRARVRVWRVGWPVAGRNGAYFQR